MSLNLVFTTHNVARVEPPRFQLFTGYSPDPVPIPVLPGVTAGYRSPQGWTALAAEWYEPALTLSPEARDRMADELNRLVHNAGRYWVEQVQDESENAR